MNCAWERPPEYDDPPEVDCLNCGYCEWCIERSIEFAREMNDVENAEPTPSDTDLVAEVERLRAESALLRAEIDATVAANNELARFVKAATEHGEKVVADAVAAERERCAKLAESLIVTDPLALADAEHQGSSQIAHIASQDEMCRKLATYIRE